jgi:hypothetical protein
MWRRRNRPRAGRPTGGRDLTVLAIPVFLAAMATEWVLLRRREWADPDEAAAAGGPTTGGSNTERPLGYDARDTVASLAMGIGMLLDTAGVGRLLAPGMHLAGNAGLLEPYSVTQGTAVPAAGPLVAWKAMPSEMAP